MSPQVKKGVLKLCVLSKVNTKDRYGYEVYLEINKALGISESTIYPILRSLVKEGICSTYLAESSEGPPRKYFKITDKGKEHFNQLLNEWDYFKTIVDGLIEKK